MNKKQILIGLLALTMGTSVAFLGACTGPGENGGGGGGGGAEPSDPVTPVDPDKPVVTEPVWTTASSYFDGAKALLANNNYKNNNGETKSFISLLDNQIKNMAFEICHRLVKLYDSNPSDENYVYTDGEGNKYSYIRLDYIIETPSRFAAGKIAQYAHSTGGECGGAKFNLNCAGCFSVATANGHQEVVSGIENNSLFNFSNALINPLVGEEWKMNNIAGESIYDLSTKFYYNYHEKIETGIANMLAGTNNLDYNAALSKIDHLGITAGEKTKLVNYIKTDIIGSSLVELDNSRNPRIEGDFNMFDHIRTITDEQHKFKNYEFLINRVVEMTVNNTFYDTYYKKYLDTKLYPTAPKNVVENLSLSSLASSYNEYEKIVLKPKNNTPITELKIAFAAQDNVTADFDINFKVVANGVALYNKVIAPKEGNVVQVNQTNKTYTFRLGEQSSGRNNFTKYNASDSEVTSSNLNPWTTNISITQNGNGVGIVQPNLNNGDSYVELTLKPKTNNIKMKVNISEYVDKIN